MKKITTLFITLCIFMNMINSHAQVGINTDESSPDESAMLDVKSTDKGILVPRMELADIEDITSPANGLLVFNISDDKFYVYIEAGNVWKEITYGAGTISGPWECGNSLVYDEQNYDTEQIGDQCWMAENLNIGTRINGNLNSSNNSLVEKYCFNDEPSNCTTYGALYQWDEMMQYVTTEATQGICPTGWHLPSDDEYKALEIHLGMTQAQANTEGWRGTNQGSQLADDEPLWTNGALDINGGFGLSGFTAIPGGRRNLLGNFYNHSEDAFFWTSSENSSDVWYREINYSVTKVSRYYDVKNTAFSVRCLKD